MATAITLASNASATGSWFAWPGGRGEFRVQATFGGGTVKLQCHRHGDGGLRAGASHPDCGVLMRTWPRSQERTADRTLRRDGTGDDQGANNFVAEDGDNLTLETGYFLLWE